MTDYRVSAGQTSNGIVLNGSDTMEVLSGGTAVDTTADRTVDDPPGVQQTVFSGGTATGTMVNGGSQTDEGTAAGTILAGAPGPFDVYGFQFVESGGLATNTTVNSGGFQSVSSGGLATGTTVNSAGLLYVDQGGNVSGAVVDAGGLLSGTAGTVTSTLVQSGGKERIISAGSAAGTVVLNGGVEEVSSGGTVTGTQVQGGAQQIVDGGTAIGTLVASGAVLSASSGSLVSASVLSGGVLSAYGATETGTTVSSGGSEVIGADFASGAATGTTVLGGGVENLYEGTATGTTLTSGAVLLASGGYSDSGATIGSTDGTVVGGGAVELVFPGYVASNTTVESGGQLLLLGGTDSGTINQGGQVVSTGIVDFIPGQGYVVVGPTESGAVLGSGTIQYVLSGGTAAGTTVGSGAQQQILGGTASGSVVANQGFVAVSGGMAVGATVGSGGLFGVFSGGTASGTQVDTGGAAGIFEDGAAMVDTTVSGGGVEALLFGGVASNTTVESGGAIGAFTGTTIDTVLNSGATEGLLSGGVASGTVLNSGSDLVLLSGAVASGTISAGGQIDQSGVFVYHLFSGASFFPSEASGVTVAGGGLGEVFSGATLTGSLVSGGFPLIEPGGSSGTQPSDLTVDSGGQVTSTNVTGGATVEINGGGSGLVFAGSASATVEFGGTDTGATVLGGAIETVYGTATGTTVGSGGTQVVEYPGSATDTTVLAGGTQIVGQGSVVSGTLVSAGGSLDAAGIGFASGGTTFDASTNTLTINGTSGGEVVQLASSYAGETFAASDDGHGGTLVTVSGGTVIAVPTISGATARNATSNEQPVDPFGGVTVADPNTGALETLTITLTGSNGGTLADGSGQHGLVQSGSGNLGTYVLSGTPASISSELDSLVFTPAGGGTTTFTLTDRDSFGQAATDSTTTVTDTASGSTAGTGGSTPTTTDTGGSSGSTTATGPGAGSTPATGGGSSTPTATDTGGTGGTTTATGPGPGTSAGTGNPPTATSTGGSSGTATVTGAGGGSSTPTVPVSGPDTIAPTVVFDPTVSFSSPAQVTFTGTVSDNVGVASVGIFEGEKFLGSATIKPDGTWIFTTDLARGFHTGLGALATDTSGNQSSASSDFDLTTGTRSGIPDQPYRAVQDRYDADANFLGQTFYKADGSVLFSSDYKVLSTGNSSYTYSGGSFFDGKPYSSFVNTYDAGGTLTQDIENNRDNSHLIEVDQSGESVHSIHNDLFASDGSNERFVFSKSFGHDTIAGFQVAGPGHDTIVLPSVDMSHLAQIIATAETVDGGTRLHVDKQDTITLTGVTAAELKHHPGDLKFA